MTLGIHTFFQNSLDSGRCVCRIPSIYARCEVGFLSRSHREWISYILCRFFSEISSFWQFLQI